ncbi:MAG: ABC transporter permease [Halobacteriota archaeon]
MGLLPSISLMGIQDRLSRELVAAWAIAKKDVLIYYLRPGPLVGGVLFPLFMFLAFTAGKLATPVALVPGLIGITTLFSASSIEPVSIPIERRTETFDRLLAAPISLNALVLGESLSGLLYSVLIALVVLVGALVVLMTPIANIILIVLGILLSSLCFATMGTLFAAYPTESPGDIISMVNVVRFPLIFISGVFIPIATLPAVGQMIAYISPLTYANDLIQGGYNGKMTFHPIVDVAMLIVFILIFQLIANYLYKRFSE